MNINSSWDSNDKTLRTFDFHNENQKIWKSKNSGNIHVRHKTCRDRVID